MIFGLNFKTICKQDAQKNTFSKNVIFFKFISIWRYAVMTMVTASLSVFTVTLQAYDCQNAYKCIHMSCAASQ